MISLRSGSTLLAFGFIVTAAVPAMAQVTYDPFAIPHARGYNIPVPGGVLQPNEVVGTSPSFEILPTPYGYPPAVRVIERCQYPDGWNVTDFDRDVNGIPAGIDHTCPDEPYRGHGVRARY